MWSAILDARPNTSVDDPTDSYEWTLPPRVRVPFTANLTNRSGGGITMSDGHGHHGEVVRDILILAPQIKPTCPRWDDPLDSPGGQVVPESAV